MKIVAIGGGEIGRPGYPVETTKIDQEIVRLTEKEAPKLLFLPTASSDSQSYAAIVKEHFGERLGCIVDSLFLIDSNISHKEIADKILSTDIIYVGGGNTSKMMDIWKEKGVDRLLIEASKKNIVLSGLSAGAICWFKYGNSDSLRFENEEAEMIKVDGLNLVNALFCPHYDVEKHREEDLKQMAKNMNEVSIAIDNCCAIEIMDQQYRIISSKDTANAYKVFWKDNIYKKEKLTKEESYRSLDDLLLK